MFLQFVPVDGVEYLRLINLKGKEFVFGRSKNSYHTDCTPIKSHFEKN
jgi:hypothetical protein